KEELKTFSAFNTRLIGHPNNKVPGVEMNTGSLGHGLSVGSGIALAGKKDKLDYRTFVLMGDGEQAEGSIWEGAMFASHYKLDNLCGIIDRNKLQISGQTEIIMSIEPLADKWRAFGWNVLEINGNSMEEIIKALSIEAIIKDKPTLIIANTIKGKGLLCAENNPSWHHKVPTDLEYKQAMFDLDQMLGCVLNE
ncbi:MAG: transketolase, partial [Bacteroidales bacterium]|nr:transketolase [Bacteroidales bacterium]